MGKSVIFPDNLENQQILLDFSVILNYMDLKIWTLFTWTLFYDREKFQ